MTTAIEQFNVGFSRTYIHDYDFSHVTFLPVEAAVEWVKKACPNAVISSHGQGQAKDLTINEDLDTDADGNGWLNKQFIVVGIEHGKALALYNSDGRFSLYISK